MKILQLVTRRQFRGAEVFAAELSQLLSKNGHEVLFTGLYSAPQNVLTAKDVINLDLNGKKAVFSFSLLASLVKLLKKEKPDIIQANGSDTLKYAVMAKYFLPHINIVYRNISMVSAWSKTATLKRKFNQFLFKKVDRVTSVGQEPLDDLVKTYQYPLQKTKLIRRGIPQFEYDKVGSKKKLANGFGFPETNDMLVHIGRFSPEKNHAFLVACFEKIRSSNQQVNLLFIGEGEKLNEIKEMVIQKKLDRQIFFAGHREKVQEMLAGCDLFILGSTIEGVPGVVLEAGMQGLPTIAVKVGGVGEVVINGETGILVEKHDVVEFSNAVISLLTDAQLRSSLGAGAKKFVTGNYSLKHCVEQFEQLYGEVLSEKKTGGVL